MTRAVLALLVLCLSASPLAAQGPDPAPRARSLAVSAGLLWFGGYSIGGNTATLRRNETGTSTPAPFTLFDAATSLQHAAGIEARLGYAVTRALMVEFGGAYIRPRVAVAISNDLESSPVVLADERISQYTIDANALWQLSGVRLGRRARPYLIGGGGYLRQLYDNRVKVETGKVFNAGGGVRYWLHAAAGGRRAFGVRSEVRVQFRTGGIDFNDKTRAFPVVNVFGFLGF